MSNYKIKSQVAQELPVRKIKNKILAIGGLFSRSEVINLTNLDADLPTKDINILIGDGESLIITGTMGYSVPLSFSGKLFGWSLAEVSNPAVMGYIQVDILKASASHYPPVDTDSIVGSVFPSLVGAYTNEDENLEGWMTDLEVGDSIGFKVLSNVNCKQIHLILRIKVDV